MACCGRKIEVVKYLMLKGIDIEHKDKYGKIGYDYFDKEEDE